MARHPKICNRQVVRRSAAAKVNLTLSVLGRRPDGFHEIESWVVPVGLSDELTFAPATALSLVLRGGASGAPADASNLVWRAAAALAAAAGRQPDVEIELEKRIPVGAGLGGGSSDAAATLLGLNALWGLNWPVGRLVPIAARLGSDVPLFLQPGPAVIRGRGERVQRLVTSWKGWLVLVVPSYGVSTAEVYRRWRARAQPRPTRRAAWSRSSWRAAELSSQLFNDLEEEAFACEPRLARLHANLDGLAGRRVRMTGSGSCLFAIFDSQAEAEDWKRQASARPDEGETMAVVRTM